MVGPPGCFFFHKDSERTRRDPVPEATWKKITLWLKKFTKFFTSNKNAVIVVMAPTSKRQRKKQLSKLSCTKWVTRDYGLDLQEITSTPPKLLKAKAITVSSHQWSQASQVNSSRREIIAEEKRSLLFKESHFFPSCFDRTERRVSLKVANYCNIGMMISRWFQNSKSLLMLS